MNLQNQIDYLRLYDLGDMFDDCSVPAGLDMQRVRGAIVMRCGLLTPLYSEPELQRAATQQFFFENQWNFAHIIKVLQAEYSPIENVAEWRTETRNGSGTDNLTIAKTGNETHSGTDRRIIDEDGTRTEVNSGQDVVTREISAENATTYQADNKETTDYGRESTESNTTDRTDDFTHGHAINTQGQDVHNRDMSNADAYEMSRHGNVGVRSNQEMINQELDLLDRFNPYRFISDLYEKELMIGLY